MHGVGGEFILIVYREVSKHACKVWFRALLAEILVHFWDGHLAAEHFEGDS